MSNNIHSPKTFIETQTFKNYNPSVQVIIEKLLNTLSLEDVGYVIKIGKGKNEIITFSLESKPSTNIASVYIHREHVRIRLGEGEELKISSVDDITADSDTILDIIDKYNELVRGKRQCSIYVYADVMDKIDAIAAKEDRKPNEIIEQFLHEKTSGVFISPRHKSEFISLLKQAEMFKDILDYTYPKTLQRIAVIYLLSAFQKEYKRDTGSKFSIVRSGEWFIFNGPIHLFKEWELGYKKSETILGLALFIQEGSNNPHQLSDILQDLDDSTYPLAMNAFKILSWKYEIDTASKDVLVMPKKVIINTDELPNIRL